MTEKRKSPLLPGDRKWMRCMWFWAGVIAALWIAIGWAVVKG